MKAYILPVFSAALLMSLTLIAQAGGSAELPNPLRSNASNRGVVPIHRLLFPTSTYMIDDGTANDALGVGNGVQDFEALWFNQFDVIPGQTTIASVSIAWGGSIFRDPDINGTPVVLAIWSDPNGDGNPHDAVLLGSTNGFMLNAETNTFVTYPFTPAITLPAGASSFFVGDMTPRNNGPKEHYWQGIDTNTTHRQSWISRNDDGSAVDINHPGNNDTNDIIDDYSGFRGNFLIRADAGDGSSNITLAAATHRQQGKLFLALTWTPSGSSSSINIMRNGHLIGNVVDDGSAQDELRAVGRAVVYQLCRADGSGCSNQVSVRINPQGQLGVSPHF